MWFDVHFPATNADVLTFETPLMKLHQWESDLIPHLPTSEDVPQVDHNLYAFSRNYPEAFCNPYVISMFAKDISYFPFFSQV